MLRRIPSAACGVFVVGELLEFSEEKTSGQEPEQLLDPSSWIPHRPASRDLPENNRRVLVALFDQGLNPLYLWGGFRGEAGDCKTCLCTLHPLVAMFLFAGAMH